MNPDTISFLKVTTALLVIGWGVQRAAGTLGPKLGIGGIVFLLSRVGVMVPTFVFTTAIFAFFMFGPRNPNATPPSLAVLVVLSLICGLGATVLVVGPIFLLWRLRTPAQKLLVQPDEVVVTQTQGSHFLSGEGRGGTVTLTTTRLAFTPHRFNVQLAPWQLPLSELKGVERHGVHAVVVHSTRGKDVLSMMKRDDFLAAVQAKLAR